MKSLLLKWNQIPIGVRSWLGGAPSTALYYLLFIPFSNHLGSTTAVLLASIPSTLVSFLVQKNLIFHTRGRRVALKALEFFTVAGILVVISTLSTYGISAKYHVEGVLPQFAMSGFIEILRVFTNIVILGNQNQNGHKTS